MSATAALLQGKYICPSCLNRFRHPHHVNSAGEVVEFTLLERRAPRMNRFIQRMRDADERSRSDAAVAADAAAAGIKLMCPWKHPLPAEWLTRPTYAIGLVGMTGSGKTTYLVSAIEQLATGALRKLDVSAVMDQETQRRFSALRQRLIVDRERLPATPRIDDGITSVPFQLTVRSRGRAANLLIYDASGEQLVNEEDVAKFNRFLYASDAIILLLNPIAFPGIERYDDAYGVSDTNVHLATTMVANLGNQMRKTRRLKDHEVIEDVAVTVAVAKADMIAGLEGFPADAYSDVNAYIKEGGELQPLFEAVEKDGAALAEFLAEKEGSGLIDEVLKGLPFPTFHAISATGAPVDDSGKYPPIAQVGVVEPLIVLLARFGLLPSDGLTS